MSEKKKLKASDGVICEVDAKILNKSKLLKGLVEDFKDDKDEIPLNQIESNILKLIIEYLEHYVDSEPKAIPKPFPEKTDEEFFKSILNDDWTYNYLKKIWENKDAIKLVNAANYLQIDGLVDLLAALLAHHLSNCEIEEARTKFGIVSDMSEEERAEYDKYPLD